MDLIADFIGRYRKEYDFYEQSCKLVAQSLEASLQSAGIRAIVTYRAKNPSRLEAKVRQRAKKTPYDSVDAIFKDIVDLAGVRVAIYFPGQRSDVGSVIQKLFLLVSEPKDFPESQLPKHGKRFSGYAATHYRVRLSESGLTDTQRRYSDAMVEIQVASVLMHAWSEVEHDLIYKPLQGTLSVDEYAVLDELNGLVLAGEIALERLQRAVERRASTSGRAFSSHYDLAAALLELARESLSATALTDADVGRVDLLYRLLDVESLNTPEALAKYIKALHDDFEKRPLAEQVIDQVLSESPERYTTYARLRSDDYQVASYAEATFDQPHQSRAIGSFMALWIEFEKTLRLVAANKGVTGLGVSPLRLLHLVEGSDPRVFASADRLRRFRNNLVHGIEVPDAEAIDSASTELQTLLLELKSGLPSPKPRQRRPQAKTSPEVRKSMSPRSNKKAEDV